jgi:TonB family protein
MGQPRVIGIRCLSLAVALSLVVMWFGRSTLAQDNAVTYEPKSLPSKLTTRAAFYPPEAHRRGLTGRVCLAYSVDTTGFARNVVVLESGSPLFEEQAKRLLSATHFDVPPDWDSTGGPKKRYRMGVIFNLTNKPKRPRFGDDIPTAVITGTSLSNGWR